MTEKSILDGDAILREEVDRTVAELEQLQADIAKQGTTIKGARGQYIAHPALASITRHRKLLADLLERLGELPHETQSQKAARASRTRWQRQKEPALARPQIVEREDRVYVPQKGGGQ